MTKERSGTMRIEKEVGDISGRRVSNFVFDIKWGWERERVGTGDLVREDGGENFALFFLLSFSHFGGTAAPTPPSQISKLRKATAYTRRINYTIL